MHMPLFVTSHLKFEKKSKNNPPQCLLLLQMLYLQTFFKEISCFWILDTLNRSNLGKEVDLQSHIKAISSKIVGFNIKKQNISNVFGLKQETKIQEALLIKKLNPKLNKQLYAKGASFLLSIF